MRLKYRCTVLGEFGKMLEHPYILSRHPEKPSGRLESTLERLAHRNIPPFRLNFPWHMGRIRHRVLIIETNLTCGQTVVLAVSPIKRAALRPKSPAGCSGAMGTHGGIAHENSGH